jgi:hypothetical protein
MTIVKALLTPRLSRSEYWRLFLVVAFPIHVWSILVGFWNFQNVVERSANLMDGIAYLAYSLLASLVESIVLFIFIALIGFFFPKRFSAKRVFIHSGLIAIGILIWMMLEQLFAYLEFLNPDFLSNFFLQFTRPYVATVIGAGLFLIILFISVAWPFYYLRDRPKTEKKILNFLERITPLSILYLVLDLFSIIFVAIRNISS